MSALTSALELEDTATLEAFIYVGEEGGEVRTRNAARLELLADRVRSQSVSGRELRAELGISRQRMQQLREKGSLLGVQPPLASEYWYPRWQFQDEARPLLPQILSAGGEAGLSALSLHLLVTDPASGINNTALVELLDERPEDVLAVISGAGEIGS